MRRGQLTTNLHYSSFFRAVITISLSVVPRFTASIRSCLCSSFGMRTVKGLSSLERVFLSLSAVTVDSRRASKPIFFFAIVIIVCCFAVIIVCCFAVIRSPRQRALGNLQLRTT